MNRALQILTLVVLVGLLAGVLFTLIDISQNGIRLELAGTVTVSGIPEQVDLAMDDAVTLRVEEPANVSVTGPEGDAIPATLSLIACPDCGAPMLPVRWNPWSGEIEWICTSCDAEITRPVEP